MVFSKLSVQEKDAFFGLLDEYFQSRPELFGQSGGGQGVGGLAGTGISPAAAASVVQRALGSNAGVSAGASNKSNNPYAAVLATSTSNAGRDNVDVAHAVTVGRVAAASLAFSQGGAGSHLSSGSGSGSASSPSLPLSLIQRAANANANLKSPPTDGGAPSLPGRRTPGITLASTSAVSSPSEPGSEVDKLVTRKASVLSGAFKKQQIPGVSLPPAFVVPKGSFGPPPVRRTTSSETSGSGSGGIGTSAGAGAIAARGVQARASPSPGEEVAVAEGEWAEVLYDYNSEDPGDLAIEAGTRVFVTEKSSADWWKGQVEDQDKEGLFPASYVKLL